VATEPCDVAAATCTKVMVEAEEEVKLKPLVSVPLCPSVLVTTTLTVPAACAGVVAVMEVLLATATFVAATPPNPTVAPLAKLLPVIVTAVPPLAEPEVEEIELTIGAGLPPLFCTLKVAICITQYPLGERGALAE